MRVLGIHASPTAALFLACVLFLSGAAQSQTYKVLYAFTGQADGGWPLSAPVLDSKGSLYGTTFAFGNPGCFAYPGGCGAAFELTPGSGGWSETTAHTFTGGSDGGSPSDTLILDAAGNLYGTAEVGGDPCGSLGCGVAFQFTPGSSGWTETVLYDFPGGTDGYQPIAALARDKHGNLYSTLPNGGQHSGVVYELTKSGGNWREKVLNSVISEPAGLVIFDPSGNVYATTSYGGARDCGTVVELLHGSWQVKVLYQFTGSSGCRLWGGLALDKAGNLYGESELGGKYDMGTVFKLSPAKGGKWTETVLYSFKGGADGYYPEYCTPALDKAGNLYGTTSDGGDMSACDGYGCGTVFKMTPGKDGSWKKTILHKFTDGSDGNGPLAGVVLDAKGNLYGTTIEGGNTGCANLGCGVVFEITP